MNEILKNDLDNISSILEEIKKDSIAFLNSIDEIPTSHTDQKTDSFHLMATGLGASGALDLFNSHFRKLIVSSAGPRYWGYVIGGTTPAALAGDWLTSVFDQNTQSTQGSGDISAVVELQSIKMMAELFGLPDHFNGGFVSGATLSNFTCLGVARQWAGVQSGKDIARNGMSDEIVILAATPHSSVIKSLSMLGFGSNNIVKIKADQGRERIDLFDLEQKLIEFSGKPVILTCSAGTVNTVDFDDFQAISVLKKKYSFWMHVDAAFGAFAACSDNHQHLLSGWENADSITIDCHKWMNVPYDSAIFLSRKEHQKLQVQTFQNSNAPYLGNPAENFSYLNFLPENSRRFRALPAWFSLVAYGKEGFKWIVENSIHCAMLLKNYLEASADFEVCGAVHLNVVCFALKENSKTSDFLDILNGHGKVFMTPTILDGQLCIRAAFVNFRTTKQDVDIAIQEMEEVLEGL
ncbi:pyridoxal phosphate-dependent decarboxylase family protein [Dyadobacter frigoris]|uniref:Aspartate aminotransferase family protein n=1 Tax=Dyadobacter frigoris TaxID=2576211 RepID=A0A4U6CW96_9BACT|nr:pyridoxal-dependent decarboxylase [Dyadobacter frigoris]TKT87418.1 aspartate aminotransferase family protein [Dyadobacter frigoris]GLU52335.1 amino acid decarboxylase [Dyadobacter frigoris]